MTFETIQCDVCEKQERLPSHKFYVPPNWITIREGDAGTQPHHCCSLDCATKLLETLGAVSTK